MPAVTLEDLLTTVRELQASRERLVAAHEEERRQLHRELHDGLGPTLAAIALGIPAARNSIEQNPSEACNLLTKLGADLQDAIGEIRRVVKNLRPPVLDQFGLVTAVREHADQQDSDVRFVVDAPDQLRPLPAAVEVAAYRIVCEALTNVTMHARAQHCHLRIEVVDDGVGEDLGSVAMRQRASELGGDCVVSAMPDGGTQVLARLPLPEG